MIAGSGLISRLLALRKSQEQVTCSGPQREKYSRETNAE